MANGAKRVRPGRSRDLRIEGTVAGRSDLTRMSGMWMRNRITAAIAPTGRFMKKPTHVKDDSTRRKNPNAYTSAS